MKILIQPPQRRQQGMATVVVLALLSIVLLYLNLNMRSITGLEQELKLVERQQIKRLNFNAGTTNRVTLQVSRADANATAAVNAASRQPAVR